SFARGQRGRARPAAGRGDRRGRPAADDGPEPGARGRGAALDPAAGAAVAGEGRRGRRARRRRGHVDRAAARALRRPHPGADRPARAETRELAPQARDPLAGRPAGGERQSPPGRPVLRRPDARPEPALATAAGQSRARDAGQAALAHRREHASRPRPRRGFGDDGGEAPAPAAGAPGKLSLSQITTVTQPFADDLDAYREAGADGVGIWEMKLADDSLECYRASGLGAAAAVPAVPSVLAPPPMGG